MTKNPIVTMVGKSYAKKGFKFYFENPRTEFCPQSCRFYNPCMKNLEPDTLYEIIEIMGIEHTCPSYYHTEPMVLVKVKESDLELLLETRNTYLGSTVRYEPVDCGEDDCPYKEYCEPLKGLPPGTKIKIIDIVKKIKDNRCSDKSLSIVKVEKIE